MSISEILSISKRLFSNFTVNASLCIRQLQIIRFITVNSRKRLLYNVHINTLKKWIDKHPEIELDRTCRVLTPKQVEVIINKIGKPNIDNSFKRKP